MLATFTHVIGPSKGERARFDAGRISIGRAPDNMLCLGDSARRVSSHHAEVTRRGDHYVLRDLGSTNGTMINGRRVMVSELAQDDLIEFGAGGPLLRFTEEPAQDQVQTVAGHPNSTSGRPSVSPSYGQGLKRNANLLAALVAAMLIGALGGIVASSRIRNVDPERMSFAEIAEANAPAVVLVRVEFDLLDSNGQVTTTEARTGSGFIASESGLIITNRHLVRDWEYNPPGPGASGRVTKIEVVLPHQKPHDAMPAELYKLGENSAVDVAILKLNAPAGSRVRGFEQNINQTNQGDEVVVIGYPLGLELLQRTNDTTADPSISTGVVSRVGHGYIQLNLRAYRGNSGGPVLNRRGDVIGILTARLGDARDFALCTPIAPALGLMNGDAGSTEERK
jgi:serine protease Do